MSHTGIMCINFLLRCFAALFWVLMIIGASSSKMELEEDTSAHYATILASNMNVPGLAKIPFYPDLMVFENVHFPPEQKIYALTYIYKTAKMILGNSPLRQPLMNLILDEAALLAQNDLEAFNQFCVLSGFGRVGDAAAILKHFIKENNLAGFFALKEALPDLLKDDLFVMLNSTVISNNLAELFTAFSTFIAQNPDENLWKIFTHKQVNATVLISLLCTDFSKERIAEIVFNSPENKLDIERCLDAVLEGTEMYDPNLPNYSSFHEKFCFLIDRAYAEHVAKGKFGSGRFYGSMKLMADCAFIDFDRYREVLDSNGKFKTLSIVKYFTYVALAKGRYEEALTFLPNTSRLTLSEEVSLCPEFCKLLAARKPEWIKTYFAHRQNFLLNNADLLLAFHSQPSMEKFYDIVVTEHLPRLTYLVLSSKNDNDYFKLLEEAEKDLIVFRQCFARLQEPIDKLAPVKFVLFLQRISEIIGQHPEWAHDARIKDLATIKFKLTAEQLGLMLESFDEALLELLKSRPLGVEFNLDAQLFVKALHDEKCRGNPRLIKAFGPAVVAKAKLLCHTPVEIEQFFKITGSDSREERINAIKAQMKTIQERRKANTIDPVESAVIFMAMRRVQSAFDESVSVGGDECLLLKSIKSEALEERKSLKRCMDEAEVARTAENLKKLKIRGDGEDSSNAMF